MRTLEISSHRLSFSSFFPSFLPSFLLSKPAVMEALTTLLLLLLVPFFRICSNLLPAFAVCTTKDPRPSQQDYAAERRGHCWDLTSTNGTLHIHFMNGTQYQRNFVIRVANEWIEQTDSRRSEIVAAYPGVPDTWTHGDAQRLQGLTLSGGLNSIFSHP